MKSYPTDLQAIDEVRVIAADSFTNVAFLVPFVFILCLRNGVVEARSVAVLN